MAELCPRPRSKDGRKSPRRRSLHSRAASDNPSMFPSGTPSRRRHEVVFIIEYRVCICILVKAHWPAAIASRCVVSLIQEGSSGAAARRVGPVGVKCRGVDTLVKLPSVGCLQRSAQSTRGRSVSSTDPVPHLLARSLIACQSRSCPRVSSLVPEPWDVVLRHSRIRASLGR